MTVIGKDASAVVVHGTGGYNPGMAAQEDAIERRRVGLCYDCRHMRRITSDRGSQFYLCELSFVNANFPKYPALPVLRCSGYERRETEAEQ